MKKLHEMIQEAYVWEGDAMVYLLQNQSTETQLVFSVSGSSTCEHSGDEHGIRAAVNALRGNIVVEDGFQYTIQSATCTLSPYENEDDEDGDGDYEVGVSGKVTVLKTPIDKEAEEEQNRRDEKNGLYPDKIDIAN